EIMLCSPSTLHCTPEPRNGDLRFASVWRKLITPEFESDFSNLVTRLLAQRIRGVEMIITAVLEHFEHLDNRPVKEVDGGEILLVFVPHRRWRLEGADPRLGPPVGGERLVGSGLQRLPIHLIYLFKNLPGGSSHRAFL